MDIKHLRKERRSLLPGSSQGMVGICAQMPTYLGSQTPPPETCTRKFSLLHPKVCVCVGGGATVLRAEW